jgi:hypothetical protein
MTEYVVITGFVAIGTIQALLFCGWAIAQHFATVRSFILLPFP